MVEKSGSQGMPHSSDLVGRWEVFGTRPMFLQMSKHGVVSSGEEVEFLRVGN